MTQFDQIKTLFGKAAENAQKLASTEEVIQQVDNAVKIMTDAYIKKGAVFAAGNGGSAADAQHFIAELVSKLSRDRTPIKGFALSVDTSILTATGNDYGYDKVFSRQVYANMSKDDVFLGITTSGNSPNILKALKAAKEVGCKSILLSGKTGGEAASMCDAAILAPGETTASIQENHTIIYHTICFLLEKNLIEKGLIKYV